MWVGELAGLVGLLYDLGGWIEWRGSKYWNGMDGRVVDYGLTFGMDGAL